MVNRHCRRPPLSTWPVLLGLLLLVVSTAAAVPRLRLQKQEHAFSVDPELDIERVYQLINSRHRAHDDVGQLQQQQPPPPPPPEAVNEITSSTVGVPAPPIVVTPKTGAETAPSAATTTTTTSADSLLEPKYNFEVHSVQHSPSRYATGEQKLRAVFRQTAAVDYRRAVGGDGDGGVNVDDDGDVVERLIDDTEHYRRRLAAADARRMQQHDRSRMKAGAERRRLERLRHAERERDQDVAMFGEDDVDDDEAWYEEYMEWLQNERSPDESKSVDADIRNDDEKQEKKASLANAESVDDDVGAPIALPLRADSSKEQRPALDSARPAVTSISDVYFLAVVIGCSVAAVAGFLFAGVCWYRLHKKMKAVSEVDYPAYGVTGPAPTQSPSVKTGLAGVLPTPGDRKLAQSAQMYHFQHQKQQMIASERLGSSDVNQHVGRSSDVESDDENEDGDYTVFECPGLATNGEMEVRNPMFKDPTPTAAPDEAAASASASGFYQQHSKK